MAKNSVRTHLSSRDVVGKKVLILGEVGSGKTLLAARLLKELMVFFNPEQITVIDMAPERVGDIGGRLSELVESINKVRYLAPEKVYTPRLTGTSREQVLEYARLNRRAIEPLFSEFFKKPTKILILNDVTLYLHAGKLQTVLKCTRLTETFLVTAYRGSRLSEDWGAGINAREKRLVEKLAAFMDRIIEIDGSTNCSFT